MIHAYNFQHEVQGILSCAFELEMTPRTPFILLSCLEELSEAAGSNIAPRASRIRASDPRVPDSAYYVAGPPMGDDTPEPPHGPRVMFPDEQEASTWLGAIKNLPGDEGQTGKGKGKVQEGGVQSVPGLEELGDVDESEVEEDELAEDEGEATEVERRGRKRGGSGQGAAGSATKARGSEQGSRKKSGERAVEKVGPPRKARSGRPPSAKPRSIVKSSKQSGQRDNTQPPEQKFDIPFDMEWNGKTRRRDWCRIRVSLAFA